MSLQGHTDTNDSYYITIDYFIEKLIFPINFNLINKQKSADVVTHVLPHINHIKKTNGF